MSPCIRIPNGVVCVGEPTEKVTMASGRVLPLEWHRFFGPSVEMKNGNMRFLSAKEFGDPNVKAWIERKIAENKKREGQTNGK